MKSKFDRALSVVALSVLGAIGSVHAAPVYEIVNIEDFDLKGNVDGTSRGYALGVNANDELVGVSKGKKKLSVDDEDDDGVIDVEDGIAPEEAIVYSVFLPIIANNYTFTAEENDDESQWNPNFFSINGTTAPTDVDDEGELIINSVDTFFYGMNDDGVKVGSYTAPEKTLDYEGSDEDQEFWYYRDFELRGVAVTDDGSEIELIPSYQTYIREDDDFVVELGGWSAAAAVNNNNLVAGYASTDIIEFSSDRIDSCIDASEDEDIEFPIPVEICVQADQYPSNGRRNISYQTRAHVWQIEADNTIPEDNIVELPLGLTPDEDSTLNYIAQGLGVNNDDVVVGRSHTYRNGNDDDLYQDAAYWQKDSNGDYQYNWIDPDIFSDTVYSSIAYDVNDNGIVVGSFQKYISGYLREKFFYYDINDPAAEIVVPDDFQEGLSDLTSKPKAINNAGQVVGNIEVTYDKDKPRPKAAFLYNMNDNEFININNNLTCESKGYEQDEDGEWSRHQVEVIDGDGSILSYGAEFYVVEANSINEEGTIVGTAFVRKPVYQFDINGNLILDEDTNLPLFEIDGNGDPVTSFLTRMVVLKPTSGNQEACTESDLVEDEPYVRKGAASLAWLFGLPLLWLRRRKMK